MLPTDVLKNEHRVIEQVLNCLDKMADEAATQNRLDVKSAREAIDFLRNFADRCHHGKEEAQLFPLIEMKGFDRDNGPTGVMCSEHELGRSLIRGMASALDDAGTAGSDATERFVKSATDYVDLLRQHISKEDHCLFSMVDRALTSAEQDYLMEQFERVEAEDMGAGTHERYLQLANDLADRYGVVKASTQCDAHGKAWACGHSH